MRPLFLFLLLTACAKAAPPPPAPSPCKSERFEESTFIVCGARDMPIEIRSGHRSFQSLQAKLGRRSANVAFAMNAGMFDETGKPIGLMIEDGREVHRINRRKGGGNFHLMPNGVFLVRKDGKSEVVASADYSPATDIAYASQSGPMLLIDGKLHPKFDADGTSRYIRNGVGIGRDGMPVFVISEGAVSFGKIARFLRDRHSVRNALFFDGSVSSLWDPANGRMDSFTEFGPIVVAFKPSEASTLGRAGRATP